MSHRFRPSSRIAAAWMAFVLSQAVAPAFAPPPAARATTPAQAPPTPAAAPRVALTGVGRGIAGNVGRPADGRGDDGDLVRGRLPALEHATVLTPTTQAQNVVLDRRTGRMWIRRQDMLDGTDGVGARGNVRLDQPMVWQKGIDAAKALEYAGYDDWRLPTVHELDSIVDFGFSEPALDPHAFPQAYETLPSAYFWSSTTSPAVAWLAFYVNVRDGHRYPWGKSTPFSVRPLRVVDEGVGDVAILRTGQTVGYVGNVGDIGTGNDDDGDLRPGENQRYLWEADGTVDTAAENVAHDLVTGLTWIREPGLIDGAEGEEASGASVGGNVDLTMPLSWQTAVDRCAALRYAGFEDWRLPNVRELDSLMMPGRPGSPTDETVFAPAAPSGDPERPPSWWSATSATHPHPDQRPADGAWYVDAIVPARRHYVSPGDPPAKGRPRSVRCVRDDGVGGSGGTGDPGGGGGGGEAGSPVPPLWLAAVRGSADVAALAVETGPRRIEIKWLMAADEALDWAHDDGGLGAGEIGDTPLDDKPPFALAFQDTRSFSLHLDFLASLFPERYGGLDATGYEALVGRRATRELYAGTMVGTRDSEGGWAWGWDVAVADSAAEALTRAETTALHRRLARAFRRRPLAYAPREPLRLAAVLGWSDRRLPVMPPSDGSPIDYEAYTPGIAYGSVRLFDGAALAEAAEAGGLGRHDIVVVTDSAPADLEQVVAALVTAKPQGALSHLAVRAARRGTPNAFDRDAAAALAPWEGTLVRLLIGAEGLEVAVAEAAEAAAWWAMRRPPPVPIAPADVQAREILGLPALGELDAGGEGRGVTRFGGKATNLARLYRFLDSKHQVPGLAVPFAYFADHMSRPAGPSGPPDASFRDWVSALAVDPTMTDGATRADRLDHLREAIRDASAEEALLTELATRIDATFGPNVMVRFRSSSNAEDGLRFNGAGLYDSTSVCVADTFDDDKDGPSRCDPNQPKERTIQRGLRKVWAGLYSLRAWEERDWYGIAQTEAAMAILITPAFPDERANGVAFTGDPARPDASWMLVSAQEGDTSVVAPDPGTSPERSVLLLGPDGAGGGSDDGQGQRITGIRRVQGSSLLPAGEHVLSDAELLELGAVLLQAKAELPIDRSEQAGGAGTVSPDEVMLDLEFKVRRDDNALLIKQIRPFLPPRPETGLLLVTPRPLALCGMWRVAEALEAEHEGHVEVDLASGELWLRWGEGELSIDESWISALRVGSDRVPAQPSGPTEAVTNTIAGRDDLVGLTLQRAFVDPAGGPEHVVELRIPALQRDRLSVRTLDAATLTEPADLVLSVSLPEGGRRLLGPCGLGRLPEETVRVWTSTAAPEPIPLALRLDLRKANEPLAPYQWADLVGAAVQLGEDRARVTDLARLTYDAQRHNWDEQFLVELEPPLAWPGPNGQDGQALTFLKLLLPSGAGSPPRLELLDAEGVELQTVDAPDLLRQRSVEGAATVQLPWLRLAR